MAPRKDCCNEVGSEDIVSVTRLSVLFVLVLGCIATSAQAARDPYVDAVRATVKLETRSAASSAASHLTQRSKGVIRWRVMSYGPRPPCERFRHEPSKIRCGGSFQLEGTDPRGVRQGLRAWTTYHYRVTQDGRELRLWLLHQPRWYSMSYDPNLDFRTRVAMVPMRRPRLTQSAVLVRSRKIAGDYCEYYAQTNPYWPPSVTTPNSWCEAFDADNCKVYWFGRRGRCDAEFVVKRAVVHGHDTMFCTARVYWGLRIDGNISVMYLRKYPRWSCQFWG